MIATYRNSALDRQAKRIRWRYGVSEQAARVLAVLAYGECR